MRVAFIIRPNVFTVPGGDTVQMKETAQALKNLGVQVDIILSGNKVDYATYDLLHFFNIIDCEDLLYYAITSPVPYVISTIYVDYREYDREHRKDLIGKLSRLLNYNQVEYLKTIGKFLLKGEQVSTRQYFIKGHKGSVKYLLKHAARLLPNSESEYQRLKNDYRIIAPFTVVPNAINPHLFTSTSTDKKDLILCVARIEGRKNQLNLIRALNNFHAEVIFIGQPSPNQESYYSKCRLEAGSHIRFIDHMPQEKLLEYYARAKVHVLPSWFETTGLSSLEAGAMGCNLVVANRGDVLEYFGNYAWYCEPGSPESIRKAVEEAYLAPATSEFSQHILKNFTWQKAAEATLRGYNEVLKKTKDDLL